jgi:signal transduction histidine kinase
VNSNNPRSERKLQIVSDDPETEILRLREQVASQSHMLEQTTKYMLKTQDRLEESERMLKEQNTLLEDTVAQRTKELRQAVVELKKEIGERALVQESLEKAHDELNTLFYRSSHDFRSPICSAKGLLNLLRAEAVTQPGQQYIELLDNSLNKLDKLTRTLTTIAEVRQGELAAGDTNVREMLSKTLAAYKTEHPRHRVIEDISLPNNWTTDADLLDRAVHCLLDNAFFFSTLQAEVSVQPTVSLVVNEEQSKLLISVTDNGPGIAQEVKPQIFNMFYRGHIASKGNGLGLYYAKLAVNQLKGKLALANVPQGGLCAQIILSK